MLRPQNLFHLLDGRSQELIIRKPQPNCTFDIRSWCLKDGPRSALTLSQNLHEALNYPFKERTALASMKLDYGDLRDNFPVALYMDEYID